MASDTFIFVFRYSPRCTRPKNQYLDEVLAATCGAPLGAQVLLRDCNSAPDKAGTLMEVTVAAQKGVAGMEPLDQYEVMHWNFTDRDGGTGIVVRARDRPDPKAARKRQDIEDWARAAVQQALGHVEPPESPRHPGERVELSPLATFFRILWGKVVREPFSSGRPLNYWLYLLRKQHVSDAAAALANIGPPAIRPVLNLLLHHKDHAVRRSAGEALRTIIAGCKANVDPTTLNALVSGLCTALDDKEETVSVEAASALEQLGRKAESAIPHLGAVLDDSATSIDVFTAALAALVAVATPGVTVPRLIHLIQANNQGEHRILRASVALFALGRAAGEPHFSRTPNILESAVTLLVEAAWDTNPEVRLSAFRGLAEVAQSGRGLLSDSLKLKLANAFRGATDDSHEGVRAAALSAQRKFEVAPDKPGRKGREEKGSG